MGLDLLDLKFRIERDLHLEVSQEEFVGLWRNRDIAVGDLYELILKKLDRCTAVWEQLVEILVSTLGVDPGEITFCSRLFADLGAS